MIENRFAGPPDVQLIGNHEEKAGLLSDRAKRANGPTKNSNAVCVDVKQLSWRVRPAASSALPLRNEPNKSASRRCANGEGRKGLDVTSLVQLNKVYDK